MENNSCRNLPVISQREKEILRFQFLAHLAKDEPETWMPLEINSNYLISSNGRLKHMESYSGKIRILSASLRAEKYLYYTITANGKRKGISVMKMLKVVFGNEKLLC